MVNGEKRAIQSTWRRLLIANSSWKCNRRLSAASPQRGEMFIAWRFISLFQSSVGAQSLLPAPAKVPLPVSLLTERDLWPSARSYKHLAPSGAKTNSTVALVS